MQLGKTAFYQQAYSACSLDETYGIASQAMVDNLKTRDANHGIQSFLEKKPPTWKQESMNKEKVAIDFDYPANNNTDELDLKDNE
jgi:hypothetical protein